MSEREAIIRVMRGHVPASDAVLGPMADGVLALFEDTLTDAKRLWDVAEAARPLASRGSDGDYRKLRAALRVLDGEGGS